MECLEVDPKFCITHKTKAEKVQKYKDLICQGEVFPPIEAMIKDGNYYVKDGAHRTKAYLELGLLVWANVFEEEDYPNKHLLGTRMSWLKS